MSKPPQQNDKPIHSRFSLRRAFRNLAGDKPTITDQTASVGLDQNNPPPRPKLHICHVSIMGDEDVGKSELMSKFVYPNPEPNYDPAGEEYFDKSIIIDGQKWRVETLDIDKSMQAYKAMREQALKTSDAFIIMYEVNNRGSFNTVSKYYDQIRAVKMVAPIILVGHHLGRMEVGKDSRRDISLEEGQSLAKRLDIGFIETSAKAGTNVEETFHKLTKAVLRQRLRDSRALTGNISETR